MLYATLLMVIWQPMGQPDRKTTDLVQRLGDEKFRNRNNAGRALRSYGAVAWPALVAGLSDKDPEIVRRCRPLLNEFWGEWADRTGGFSWCRWNKPSLPPLYMIAGGLEYREITENWQPWLSYRAPCGSKSWGGVPASGPKAEWLYARGCDVLTSLAIPDSQYSHQMHPFSVEVQQQATRDYFERLRIAGLSPVFLNALTKEMKNRTR